MLSAALAGALASAACSPGSDGAQTAGPGTSSAGGEGAQGAGGGAGGQGGAGGEAAQGGAGGEAGHGGAGGGVPAACPPDADGDEIPDGVEGKDAGVDTDGDGTPDYLDTDSDGDSLPDALEGQTASVGCNFPQDSEGDGLPDFRDADSDGNGLPDRFEIYPDGAAYDPARPAPNPADTDGDGLPDYADLDNDGDSLPDTVELGGATAVDTDGDELPDLDDPDSDGDTIEDVFEGVPDPDGDGIGAFRDPDSDGDGLADACEIGPGHAPGQPPPDTDVDGKYDFLDADSDGDGLLDGAEDTDRDCALDPGETSPTLADTDSDGTSDFIEQVLASDPRDPLVTPGTLGKAYFILPYQLPAIPAENIVPLRTYLNQGDVAFLVDTTATMGGEIQDLKQGMTSIVQTLHAEIPDVAVGVAGFDDFPTSNYGAPPLDLPFYVAGATGHVSATLSDNLAAVQALNVHDGGDLPESQVAAMHRALTDAFLIWDSGPNGQLAPSGAPSGRYGSLRFRTGALPILVAITDAPFHNGRRAMSAAQLHDPYSFNGQPPFPTPTVDTLISEMVSRGARFLGVSAVSGARAGADPYEDMAYLVDQTSSYVPPSAFGGVRCATGLGGSFLLPDGPATADAPGGTCRLIFDITSTGAGLSSSVVRGVQALLKGIKLNLRALASPLPPPPSAMDAVDTFIQTIAVNAPGGSDAAEPGVPCFALNAVQQLTDQWTGPKGLVNLPDGVNETAIGVVPGQKICFKVIPKPNTAFPQGAAPQVWKAVLTVKARNGAAPTELILGAPREIAFIIPPSPQ